MSVQRITVTEFGHTTKDYVVFPHTPDWSRYVRRDREWANSISPSLKGREERLAVLPRPIYTITFDVFPYDHEEGLALVANLTAIKAEGYTASPLWGRGVLTTAETSADQITVGDTTLWNWQIADWVFLRRAGRESHALWEVAQIAGVTATQIGLTAPVGRTYPAGTRVYPLLLGFGTFEKIDQRSDHHQAVEMKVSAVRSGYTEYADDAWRKPIIDTTATDETVEHAEKQHDAEIHMVIRGGVGPFTIVSHDGLETKTGTDVTWEGVTGGDYTFTVTDSLGNDFEQSVHVYTEEYEITEEDPYWVLATNDSDDPQYLLVALSGVTKYTLPDPIPPHSSVLFSLGPEPEKTNHQTWNQVGFAPSATPYSSTDPLTITFDGSSITSAVYDTIIIPRG